MNTKLRLFTFIMVIVLCFTFTCSPALAVGASDWAAFPLTYQGHSTSYLTMLIQAVVATYNSTTYAYIYNNGGVDGFFGSGTTNAVKTFQSAKGLTADGKVGSLTWAALYTLLPVNPPLHSYGTDEGSVTGIMQETEYWIADTCILNYGKTDHHWYGRFQRTQSPDVLVPASGSYRIR